MSEIVIYVDGQPVDVGALWVHFQEAKRAPASPYRIIVPSEHVKRVFDPLSKTGPDKPLLAYINELVAELGSFMVEGYIKEIAELTGMKTKGYRLVIASVDSVRELDDGIELVGKALRFDPSLYD
jgi:hypothetical protein